MKISVCTGYGCRQRGSQMLLEDLEQMVRSARLGERVEVAGQSCMGDCRNGVCVKLDGVKYSLTPADGRDFFEKEVLPRLKG